MAFPTPDIKTFTIPSGGTTDTIDLTGQLHELYVINGSASLIGNYTLQTSGSPQVGLVFQILYTATINIGFSNDINILGKTLSADEALNNALIEASWNGSSWDVVYSQNGNTAKGITFISLITGGTYDIYVSHNQSNTFVITGSPTLASNVAITGHGALDGQSLKIYYLASPTTGGTNTVTIFGKLLSDFAASNGAVYIETAYDLTNTIWRTALLRDFGQLLQISELSNSANMSSLVLPVSWEAGEQTSNRVYIYTDFIISGVNYTIVKAISGTDNANLTIQIAGTTVTGGAIVIPLSSAVGTTGSSLFTALQTGVANSYIDFITQKTTVGGKALLSIKITKLQ